MQVQPKLNLNDFMKDAKGRMVPRSMVSEIDQQRDELVCDLLAKAKELQAAMVKFKRHAMDDVAAFVDLSAEMYGVKMGGQKGNISLVSFDGRMKVQVAISDSLAFDERLQVAKSLIDECINEWAEGSKDELRVLVMDAFQVDKEGRINAGRILGLRRLAIIDDKWQRAMDAISDSLRVVGSKSYFRVYERDTPDSGWNAVTLDIAGL